MGPKKITPIKSNKCSPVKPMKSKQSVCRSLSVEYASDSSEGPLSDIDDILTGNILDIEKHTLASIVFDPSNPHLEQVLERMSADDEEASEAEIIKSSEK